MSENIKSPNAEREEKILKFWKENKIFEKSLAKNEGLNKTFVFYEGPPTANGLPGIHHLEARAFKDVIPRYKTMQGFYVRRKGGWDTHGLPVELQVEKELGLKSKKEIESFGIGAFNEKCKESVWQYVHEWEKFTDRMGYWIDLKNPYITYKPYYIESLWHIVKKISDDGLLYKDYKVVPWCPRCGTGLSSHELAQGYETVKDLSVYVKFKIVDDGPEQKFFLAWTTTPWTLPANVALAVGEKIEYVEIKIADNNDRLILAKERLAVIKDVKYEILNSFFGKDLVGMKYQPLYDFVSTNLSGAEKDKLKNAFKVYGAEFVTTADGTGIVHTAVMYGQDDFELGTKVGLPKYHLVNEDGTFKKEGGFLAGAFVKDQNTDIAIIKDLAGRSLLFAKEKYEHTYPFCWRCHTALIYFARDSWYISMSEMRKKLVKENENINWEPAHIKEGRFGEWLKEVKDWAISRERYWGTPLPVWICDKCTKKKVAGSVLDISLAPKNTFTVIRHGEAENNTEKVYDCGLDSKYHLTEIGKGQVKQAAKQLTKQKIDLIVSSPLLRTKETAEIIRENLGLKASDLIYDERLRECIYGIYDGHPDDELSKNSENLDRYVWRPEGGENYTDIKKRMGDCLYDLESKYSGKHILIVTHETPAMLLSAAAQGLDIDQTKDIRKSGDFLHNAEIKEIIFRILPHNQKHELDLHRPYIDEVKLVCDCGGQMTRVKEVMDVWFDSGSMPFAQDHYPFHNQKYIDKDGGYPADYISEAIDQTRGWFYTLHAVGVLMGKGKAYKNVICLGHILDAQGKKMSKSIGNTVNPNEMMDKYGADALRFWMYSVNQPGDSKNFDEKTVDEIVKKVFNLTQNVAAFYEMYAGGKDSGNIQRPKELHVLDEWILAKLNELTKTVTADLEGYKLFDPSRAIREFVAELSQWYLRRSRDRFKNDVQADRHAAIWTTGHVLLTLAKLMAPFTPFFAEHLYKSLAGQKESVHLEVWPKPEKYDPKIILFMEAVRNIASKGLEARMKAKINVRQPLQSLSIQKSAKNNNDQVSIEGQAGLLNLIKDEVNVKEIFFNDNQDNLVELDLHLTDELKEEGVYRELVRAAQDLRKEKGLSIKDLAVLKVDTDGKGQDLINKVSETLKKAAMLEKIEIVALGEKYEAIKIGEFSFKMFI